jgi:hypothetical protein
MIGPLSRLVLAGIALVGCDSTTVILNEPRALGPRWTEYRAPGELSRCGNDRYLLTEFVEPIDHPTLSIRASTGKLVQPEVLFLDASGGSFPPRGRGVRSLSRKLILAFLPPDHDPKALVAIRVRASSELTLTRVLWYCGWAW